ncbi:MAG: efflux RND transporter periplasmic adaptor subunit [Marinicaulis sp.]|nr:efflux RND transporter periplasmic adaptor subunit [Marinicaulis sp.]
MALIRKSWRWVLGLSAIMMMVGFFFASNGSDGAMPSVGFETVSVDQGPISQAVATSGSVRPLVTVQVGSQLSGQVAELLADFNSEVSKGDLIARIDPQEFLTQVESARAGKTVATANLLARRADVRRAEAFRIQRKSDVDRYESLGEEAGLSAIEMDALRAQYIGASADLDGAQAQVLNAEANVIQADATLEQAELDLSRTEIRSPINGVVILRSVDVGQTVAASLSAPVLFEIAQDLSLIQIEADVNEADIGSILKGNPVSFTVDAYPRRNFSGIVETVRLAPNELENVVTYTVIIHADNFGRLLFPGMTATVEIITGEREGTLRIPNAAARFRPANAEELLARASGQRRPVGGRGPGGGRIEALAEQLELDAGQKKQLQEKMQAMFAGARSGGGPPGGNREQRQKQMNSMLKKILTDEQWQTYQAGQKDRPRVATIWVLSTDGKVEPRRVRLGIADGSYTEVVNGDIAVGDAVITRKAAAPRS